MNDIDTARTDHTGKPCNIARHRFSGTSGSTRCACGHLAARHVPTDGGDEITCPLCNIIVSRPKRSASASRLWETAIGMAVQLACAHPTSEPRTQIESDSEWLHQLLTEGPPAPPEPDCPSCGADTAMDHNDDCALRHAGRRE